MNIGLYFGAFNPVHDGHLHVAKYVLNSTDLDEIWLVLTPQSPHKTESILIDFYHRYKMLELVCKKHKCIFPSDIEKDLKKPNYTIRTLDYLKTEKNSNDYNLIIGDDNIEKLKTWKEYLSTGAKPSGSPCQPYTTLILITLIIIIFSKYIDPIFFSASTN